jgi:beta-lactamase regulating signal transducer with metallopeptidase domain
MKKVPDTFFLPGIFAMPLAILPAWLDSLASTGHLHRLGWVVLHSLWQAAAVAAVLAVALRLLPRRTAFGQEARYLLATLALLSLPVACGVTWTLVEPARLPPRAAADHSPQPGPTLVIPAAVAGSLDRGPIAAAPAVPAAPAAEPTASLSTSDAVRILAAQAAAVAEPWLPTCAALWLAGVLAAALRLVVGWSLTRRLVATAAPLPDTSWQTRLARWTSALGIAAPIRLLASARVDVPIVVGWLRPVVIWPVAAVTGMPPEQIDAILAHELAHVRRHDVLVNLLQSVIEAVFFHHPAAWWISAQVRAEREHCADELAIRALAAGKAGSRISYATALLSLEERRQAILVAAANGGSLGDRIRRLVGVEQQSGHPARLAAAVVLLVLVAITATLAAPPGGATNMITSLTPEEARRLVETFPGVEVEVQNKGWVRVNIPCLPLNGLRALDAETARVLAAFAKGSLQLNGLTTLDAAAAEALGAFRGDLLALDGLTELSAGAAKGLAAFQGEELSLVGLTTISADAAASLAAFKKDSPRNGTLDLNGITALDAAAAKELAAFKGQHLFLRGLTRLDAKTSEALSGHWRYIPLFITEIDVATAKALAAADWGSLELNSLTRLDADAAQALAEFRGDTLNLNGLTKLDAESAKALAEFKGRGDLELNGLTTIDVEVARALAGLKVGMLSLQGLTKIDAEAAESLAACTRLQGYFPNLTRLDAKAAKALTASDQVTIVTSRLTALDGETARLLVASRGGILGPDTSALVTLDAEAAQVLAASKQWNGNLSKLSRIDADAAKSLAEFAGFLTLDGLTKLDADTARALAASKCRTLKLGGLTTLDADTAKALSEFKGQSLFLDGLTSLDASTAKALAEFNVPGLALPGITALDSPDSVAIAEALATRKGPLNLPNLEKISPKTLAALIEKEDVQIPLIETLELIPEPDGSPTEDFVIPEGFRQRQQR